MYLNKINQRLSSFSFDPYDLSIISQKNCPRVNDPTKYNIDIDGDTFSVQLVAGVFRKAGEKIGDGIVYIAGGVKKLYNNDSNEREDQHDKKQKYTHGGYNPDAEWLP